MKFDDFQTDDMWDLFLRLKNKHPNEILLFSMGEFYKAYEMDAATVSKEIGLPIKSCLIGNRATPMAEIPKGFTEPCVVKLKESGLKIKFFHGKDF